MAATTRSRTAPVVVIGSGPVGAVASRRLAELGRDVVLLEAGHAVPLLAEPSAPPGEHLRNQARFRVAPASFLAEALARCDFYDSAAPPEGLPGACETIALGGQGLVWTNNCPRTRAGVDRWDALDEAGWERCYAAAEAMLQVGIDPLGASERGRRIAATLAPLLRRTSPEREVCSLPLAGRADGRGGIRYSATAVVLEGCDAAARSRVQVRTGARAVAIETSAGRATGVLVEERDPGAGAGAARARSRCAADAVLVAAGAFATPRLLHASGLRAPALGRWLHYHPLLLGQIVLEESLAAPAGAGDPPPRLWLPPSASAPWHGMILRDIGAGEPAEEAPERRLVELQFFAPVAPRRENAMTLDGARPRFSVELAAEDRAVLAAMRAEVLALGDALGRWRRGCEPGWNPWGFSHPMGTTRMGDDPAESVVDRSGRVHGWENVHVAGPGVIPVPIAINPTLTAAALAIATAEAVVSRA